MSEKREREIEGRERDSEREKIEGEKVVYSELLHKRIPLNYYIKLLRKVITQNYHLALNIANKIKYIY